jgi:hypothetical protein
MHDCGGTASPEVLQLPGTPVSTKRIESRPRRQLAFADLWLMN